MIGYLVDLTEAQDYFTNERLETECWDKLAALSSAFGHQIKALFMAFNRIYYDPAYDLPDPLLPPNAAQLTVLKKAQCEEAYYLACHLHDEDRRKGIQAQGVIYAGIVKENYYADWLGKLPVPPFVDALLEDFYSDINVINVANIDRLEDEDANTKIDRPYGIGVYPPWWIY